IGYRSREGPYARPAVQRGAEHEHPGPLEDEQVAAAARGRRQKAVALMGDQKVLVVLLEDGDRTELRRAIARRSDDAQNVRVVAPTKLGTLQWLTSDEDEPRADARARASTAGWLLAD